MKSKQPRRAGVTIRLTDDETDIMNDGYSQSSRNDGKTQYLRAIILGQIPHPNYDISNESEQKLLDVKPVGKVKGSYENRVHYDAVVIAATLLRIKLDPDYHKYITAEPDMFHKLIEQIRGYKFDDETELKTPLESIFGEVS